MTNLYQQILIHSKEVNDFWKDRVGPDFSKIEIHFKNYSIKVFENFSENIFPANSFFIIDNKLHISPNNFLSLESSESKTKNIDYIHALIEKRKENFLGKTLVAVGGGVILDTALCIAQILGLKIILVPTTVIAMSDSSIGGKARANKVQETSGKQIFIKHFFREFYDPGEIILCESFLETIPEKVISLGCAEIIKHAFFQSDDLLHYLMSEDFDPFNNKKSLMKAILWTADLKRICMEVDPQETYEGSRKIIREGHVEADKLEKESGFTMGHGEAVLHGLKHDLCNDPDKTRLEKFNTLCEKLRIVV